ncbi:DUF305 domain-containing protein [Nonomuraea sp. NBC_01738]|uniref:DUF305 domain-containing protein n=1 Tax=Nonomuraea sp. NBC_01738 TaxID=2976003 RepID=UPI002E15DC81|nr:DUF305 domain-containing protein [Nonomuraea sp. NBC_01738]
MILIGGCSGERTPGGVVPSGGPPVIVPAGPGETARTATPGQTVAPERRPNAADVRFAEAMIEHHRAALDMAALVAGRSESEAVIALAARIRFSQQPEISWLTTWLAGLGRTVAHGGSHDLGELRAVRGSAFDRLFVTRMITHHEAALDLALAETRAGSDAGVRRLAADIEQSQGMEIDRMRAMLARF